jgi:hypothetical protein
MREDTDSCAGGDGLPPAIGPTFHTCRSCDDGREPALDAACSVWLSPHRPTGGIDTVAFMPVAAQPRQSRRQKPAAVNGDAKKRRIERWNPSLSGSLVEQRSHHAVAAQQDATHPMAFAGLPAGGFRTQLRHRTDGGTPTGGMPSVMRSKKPGRRPWSAIPPPADTGISACATP